VLLTIGRRGSPRPLGVEGEDKSKVVYRLIEPEQYKDNRVIVVGGGDSALEAAATLAEETNASVVLAYRGNALGRAKPKNRERIKTCVDSKKLELWLNTEIVSIADDHVVVNRAGALHKALNDAIIVCAGGVLPTGEAGRIESDALATVAPIPSLLAAVGMRGERRALMLRPLDLRHRLDADSLELEFALPRGGFAQRVRGAGRGIGAKTHLGDEAVPGADPEGSQPCAGTAGDVIGKREGSRCGQCCH
jgi:hypothetical protein